LNLDFVPPDLDFVPAGLDFVPKDLDIVPGDLEILHGYARRRLPSCLSKASELVDELGETPALVERQIGRGDIEFLILESRGFGEAVPGRSLS
jgi:hypothetical protein